MLTYIKLILNSLSKFVNLPDNKKIIYLMSSIIIIAVWLTVFFYKKNERAHIQIRSELERSEQAVQILVKEKDSLYKIIYNIKLDNLKEKLDRSDSLLRESEKIKNSLSPIIKRINKKIENNK